MKTMECAILSETPITDELVKMVKDVFDTAINPNGAFKSVDWVTGFTGEIVYAGDPDKCEYKRVFEVHPRY